MSVEDIRSLLLSLLDQDEALRERVRQIVLESELLKEMKALREDFNARFEAVDRRFEAVDRRFEAVDRRFEVQQEQIKALREDFNKRFEAIDRRFEAVDRRFEVQQEQIKALREDFNKRFEAVDRRFEAVDRRFEVQQEQIKALREDFNKRFEAVDRRFEAQQEQIKALREDFLKLAQEMAAGFQRVEAKIGELGARWGIQTEEAVREFARRFIAEEFGVQATRWKHHKNEIDVVIHNGAHHAVEVKAHCAAADIRRFASVVKAYEQAKRKKVKRRILITGHAGTTAWEKATELGIEIISG